MVSSVAPEIPFFERVTYKNFLNLPNEHFHNNHELYYLKKGKASYFIGNEFFSLEEGDLFFVPKDTFHKTTYAEDRDTERVLFSFDDSFVSSDLKQYIDYLKENKFIRIRPEKLYLLQNIINSIEEEERKKQPGYLKMQQLYFMQMLVLISRYSLTEYDANHSESYTLIQNMLKYVSENYNSDLTLTALSNKFAMSPSHLSRLFKRITAVSLNEYINISRITAAEKMLLNPDMSITQVATECGFNDSNYFAAVFKKIKGITPKKYAIANRKNSSKRKSYFKN